MGSRVGYRVVGKEWNKERVESDILRKQWISSIEEGVVRMWNTLGLARCVVLEGKKTKVAQPANDNALREDLDCGRATAALFAAFYAPPFDSIEKDVNCDINDNGLIEVDVTEPLKWKVHHYEIGVKGQSGEWDWGAMGKKTLIAEMTEKGFRWKISEDERAEMGEGLE